MNATLKIISPVDGSVYAERPLADDKAVRDTLDAYLDKEKMATLSLVVPIWTMGQITGALWGIALVLSAVFVPMAFFGGSTGFSTMSALRGSGGGSTRGGATVTGGGGGGASPAAPAWAGGSAAEKI